MLQSQLHKHTVLESWVISDKKGYKHGEVDHSGQTLKKHMQMANPDNPNDGEEAVP